MEGIEGSWRVAVGVEGLDWGFRAECFHLVGCILCQSMIFCIPSHLDPKAHEYLEESTCVAEKQGFAGSGAPPPTLGLSFEVQFSKVRRLLRGVLRRLLPMILGLVFFALGVLAQGSLGFAACRRAGTRKPVIPNSTR